jgi:hypothetical protein
MARTPPRRGGSYSKKRAATQRPTNSRSSNARRTNGGRSGYAGGGRGGGGNDQMPIYLGLGAGAVVLIGALAFLLAGSGGDDTAHAARADDAVEQPSAPAVMSGSSGEVLPPFSSAEKAKIHELIQRLDGDYDRAKELKDEGFREHSRQNYEAAQAAWQEAQKLLRRMNDASNDLEIQFGEGIWERMEQFMPTESRTIARWGRLLSDITKQLNTSLPK